MNEYDSDKMADVLRAAEGYEPTSDVEEADLILFNTCSVREKAQEKVFSDLGRVKHLKNKGVLIGVGGCVASQEGAAIIERAPYVDVVFGPQTLHRLPRAAARARSAQQRPQVDISFPEIEKFDHLPPARVDGATRLRLDHGRLLEVLLATASCPTRAARRSSRPFDDVLIEVAGLADQGVKEVTLLGQNVNAYRGAMGDTAEIADFALLIEYVAEIPGIERIRYTTSHPNEFTQRADRRLRQGAQAGEPPAPAGAARQRPHPDGDEARLHRAWNTRARSASCARCGPDISLSSDFIVGFPGETDDDFAQDDEADRRRRLRHQLQLRLQPAPRHAGRGAARRHAADGQAASACSSCRRRSRPTCARISASRVGTVQRILVEGPSRKDAERADGPHRVQPHRQLQRPAAPGRPDDRRDDHRGAAAFAARRCRCPPERAACRASSAQRRACEAGATTAPARRRRPSRRRWPSGRRGRRRPGRRPAPAPRGRAPSRARRRQPTPASSRRHSSLASAGGEQPSAERRREEVEQVPEARRADPMCGMTSGSGRSRRAAPNFIIAA